MLECPMTLGKKLPPNWATVRLDDTLTCSKSTSQTGTISAMLVPTRYRLAAPQMTIVSERH